MYDWRNKSMFCKHASNEASTFDLPIEAFIRSLSLLSISYWYIFHIRRFVTFYSIIYFFLLVWMLFEVKNSQDWIYISFPLYFWKITINFLLFCKIIYDSVCFIEKYFLGKIIFLEKNSRKMHFPSIWLSKNFTQKIIIFFFLK